MIHVVSKETGMIYKRIEAFSGTLPTDNKNIRVVCSLVQDLASGKKFKIRKSTLKKVQEDINPEYFL